MHDEEAARQDGLQLLQRVPLHAGALPRALRPLLPEQAAPASAAQSKIGRRKSLALPEVPGTWAIKPGDRVLR